MKAKVIILLVLCIVFIASFASGAYAYGSSSYFDGTPIPAGELLTDRDDLISAEDEIAIISALSSAEENCNAAVRAYVYSGDYYFDYENYIYNSV